jgi:hypothetical protein
LPVTAETLVLLGRTDERRVEWASPRQLGLTQLGTLHERIGDTLTR